MKHSFNQFCVIFESEFSEGAKKIMEFFNTVYQHLVPETLSVASKMLAHNNIDFITYLGFAHRVKTS